MDSPSPPQAPDPTAVAQAQGEANKEAARLTATLNRVNQFTPYGSMTWAQGAPTSVFNQERYDKAVEAARNGVPSSIPGQGAGSWSTTGSGENISQQWVPGQAAPGAVGADGQPILPDRNDQQFYDSTPSDNWSSTITLDPRLQALLDSNLATSQGLNSAVNNQLGAVTNEFSKPQAALPGVMNPEDVFNPQNLPAVGSVDFNSLGTAPKFDISGVPALANPDEGYRQHVEDSLYKRLASRLDPRFGQDENELRSSLMNRGLVEGSEAWNTQMDQFGREKNDAYSSAALDSVIKGGEEMARLFGMNLAGRQQGVGEALTSFNTGMAGRQQGTRELLDRFNSEMQQRQQSLSENTGLYGMQVGARERAISEQERRRTSMLNELNALRSGQQVQQPSFQPAPPIPGPNPAPIAQAMQNKYQADMGMYNADVASNNNTMSTMGSLANTAAMIAMFSDRRLKRNIQRIGVHPLGVGIYSYQYIHSDDWQVGVMADEVEQVLPEAVITHPSGFKMVNYGVL